MVNIDENALSALLERIGKIKYELEALENEVRTIAGSVTPANGNTDEEAADIEVDIMQEPIDISISEIEPITAEPEVSPAEAAEPIAAEPEVSSEETAEAAAAPVETVDDLPEAEPEPAAAEPEPQIEGSAVEEPASAEPAAEEPTIELGPATGTIPADDDMPYAEDDDLPFSAMEPETPKAQEMPKLQKAIVDAAKAENAVIDVMAEKQAWRTDRPGTPVKNVISAISLNDRVLLINVLFKEDPMLFQDTIAAFNGMESFDDAVAYVKANFSEWDLDCEPVYRLMMAVRRKLK